MIGYIKGTVLSKKDGAILIENNGIGYEVTCSASLSDALEVGAIGEVYTYMAVREDGVYLYGFISLEEKQMFLKLISVSGVGPKMGIGILSGMDINDLAIKIATSDIKGLSAIKGLGKKTAERIIVELREKMQALSIEEQPTKKSKQEGTAVTVKPEDEDAILALMSLGFTKGECVTAVKLAEDAGITTVPEVVRYALKHIK